MSAASTVWCKPPLTTRFRLFVRTWFLKIMLKAVFNIPRYIAPSIYRKYSPTYTKRYPVRPTLECRFFMPKSYTSGSSLPLYIDIHGGAFFACDPQVDDKLCYDLCNRLNGIVVSLEYRLAPSYPFPVPVDDCTALALAVLEDTDLPFDHEKVVMGGQSAGGSLALAVAQDPRLQTKIKALVPFYPCTDFSHTFAGAYRDKPADANGKGGETDMLRMLVPPAEWAYMQYGQDLTDPRLSPVYARPESLPKHIYFVAAQYDKLCQEAFNLAKRLAGSDNLKEDEDWDVEGIRWERLPNEVHGFIETAWRGELSGSAELPWKKEVADVLDRVADWIEQVFRES